MHLTTRPPNHKAEQIKLKGRNGQFNNAQDQHIYIDRMKISGYRDWQGRQWGVTDNNKHRLMKM